MKRAKAECKACGGIQDATRNDNNEPVYVCRCCWAETTRRINNCKARNERKARIDATIESILNGTF